MRDGVKIAIDVVLPKNLSSDDKIPALLVQTRYWRAAEIRAPFKWFQKPNEFQRFFTSHGYALVFVDVRGTGASFGTSPYPWSRDEIMDGSDIVNWIVTQPWSNGKVGAFGVSYLGVTAELVAVPNNPAVKAVIPKFSQFDLYTEQVFPGGVFNEWLVKNWAYNNTCADENNAKERIAHINRLLRENEASFAEGQLPKGFRLLKLPPENVARLTVAGVKPVDSDKNHSMLKEAVHAHKMNGDVYKLAQGYNCRDDTRMINNSEYSIDTLSVHSFREGIERSNVAIYVWGSWFDGGTADGVIRRFLTYSNPLRAVIGPWSHGAGYHASPYLSPDTPIDPNATAQLLESLRFFDHYLKNIDTNKMNKKILIYYTLGEEKWKTTTVWPPAGVVTQRLYLAKGNSLSQKKPKEETGADEYTIDFEATTGKANRWQTQFGGFAVVYADRTKEGSRLLTYTSPPLTEDTEITGYPVVTLHVTSTATDGAFFVYFEDVDETDKVAYITEGQLRAIHRKISDGPPPYNLLVPYHSFKKNDAAPLVPGEVAELRFGLLPTSVLIKKGHRMRIAIAGHDKDTFARIPAEETPTITIERNKSKPSSIDFPILSKH
jgi:putative CocE/NonD family hydrolase